MNRADKQGFTLIELMLAMGFVSTLLLAIAMIVIFIGNIYNKGITYKDVDQTGSSLTAELKRSISLSSSFDVETYFIQQNIAGKLIGGRLCTGQYSYIWNYGSALNPELNSYRNMYKSSQDKIINFVKVYDSSYKYCQKSQQASYLPVDENDKPVDLIDVGQHNLAIHDFNITLSASDPNTRQSLYNISFTLGTNNQLALSNSTDGTARSCLAPGDRNIYPGASPDPSYCAVNQFNIVVRAGGQL